MRDELEINNEVSTHDSDYEDDFDEIIINRA
jgi:hypothetical protein